MDTLKNQRARQVAVPAAARALCTLSHIDYEDAFLVEAGAARQPTASDWVKAFFDDAPIASKVKLLLGWSAIGLIPAMNRSAGSVLGWEIRASTSDFVLLGRSSLIGMPGQLLFKREPDALLFATFVQHDNPIARTVWAATEPQHVPIVHDLLEQAAHRLAATA
ncbi:hypothetical protein [Mycobacterium sp.]|uniref:hypothetical protein n=1 Tax=Mycobacterium sp. TaxID=1785 RepID=UPI002C373363|nr:hypothetical protein [Mycobacterium sp.]HKP41055.1 hypothetical protein [Mycobacterium sp.]